MRVRFQPIESPCYVQIDDAGESRVESLWPVVVDLAVDGKSMPLRFAWDRWHGVLYVDAGWPARALLGDREAAARAATVAKEVLRRAASKASEGPGR